MTRSIELIEDEARGIRLEVLVEGEGPDVVLVPSAMRGAEDFAQLQAALSKAGYRSLALNPRHCGRSRGTLEDLTLQDIADDIALVVERLCGGRPAHLVGHAQGNISVRSTAAFRPEVARSVSVMPCGGHDLATRPQNPHVTGAVGRCHDHSLSVADRLDALRIAFFAPGNDPSLWLEGWWPDSEDSARAIWRTPPELWWDAGQAPLLVIQPMNDPMAAPEVGRDVVARIGGRARYVEVENCSHAILPEQPEAVAKAVIGFLNEVEQRA